MLFILHFRTVHLGLDHPLTERLCQCEISASSAPALQSRQPHGGVVLGVEHDSRAIMAIDDQEIWWARAGNSRIFVTSDPVGMLDRR